MGSGGIFITGQQSALSAILKMPRRFWALGVKKVYGEFFKQRTIWQSVLL